MIPIMVCIGLEVGGPVAWFGPILHDTFTDVNTYIYFKYVGLFRYVVFPMVLI